MIRKVSFAALAVLGCSAAGAAADNRIRSLAYDPNHIVQILGKPGIQSTIEFGEDERIENVAVGDSNAWQITPNHRAQSDQHDRGHRPPDLHVRPRCRR